MSNQNDTRMPSFEGGQPGTTATLKFPIGQRYHSVSVEYSGLTLADMTEIRLKLNNKPFRVYRGAEDLNAMNKEAKIANADGILKFVFDRVGLLNRADRELTAINTGVADSAGRSINAFTLEIDIKASVTGLPQFNVTAETSGPVQGGAGALIYVLPETRSIAGAGSLEVSDYTYNTPEAQAINAMHFKPTAGEITKAEIKRNLFTILERSKKLNERKLIDGGVREPQTGWFHLDTCEKGYGGNSIDVRGVNDFRVILECSEATQVTAYIEQMGSL